MVSLSILYKDRTAMSLLSLDILEGKTSKYETNHIHMIVDGDISFPVTNMNDKQYGTFFHEYIHYLQHFTTMFGVKICTMYNKNHNAW